MTRSSDITLGPTDRVRVAQEQFGKSDNVIIVSNHINAGGGASFYVIKLCVGV